MSGPRRIALPTYEVTVAPGALAHIPEVAADSQAHRYVVITDDNVGPLYSARVRDAMWLTRAAVTAVISDGGGSGWRQ